MSGAGILKHSGNRFSKYVTYGRDAASGGGGGGTFLLRGDPTFDETLLSGDDALWYQRFWAAIEHPDQYPSSSSRSLSGDLYAYGRDVNVYVSSLMMGFRVTGDLRLLDDVDRVAENMRAQLQTQWVDANGNFYEPNDGTEGYLRWNWLKDSSWSGYGTDTHEMDTVMTLSVVAMFAFAFENNRDLVSPGGVNYGARADFWFDYLENHFEAIWRIRSNKPTGLPYLRRNLSHPWANNIRFNHYMHLLTVDSAYAVEAEFLIGKLMEEQVEVSTSIGPAFVWAHGVISAGSSNDFLQPTTYVKYDLLARGDLVLEGFSGSMDDAHMQKIANALSQFVDDGDPDNTGDRFAESVGGDTSRGGLTFNAGFRTRESESRWAVSSLSLGAVWDSTGLVDAINDDVYAMVETDLTNPRRVHIPAAKVLMLAYR